MPRVGLVTSQQAPLLAQPYFAGGDPGPIVASLALAPEMAEVALPFLGRILGASSIDVRTKELVIVRTSALQRCEYCTLTHAAVALDVGLPPAEVASLCDAARPTAFPDEREAAILAWTDSVAMGPGSVPDDVAQRLTGTVPDHDVVELTLLIGATLLLNRYCTALELPVSSGSLITLASAGLDAAGLVGRERR